MRNGTSGAPCPSCGGPIQQRPNEKPSVFARRLYCSRRCSARRHPPPSERFWTHVRKTNGCWEWTASTGDHGYGTFADSRTRLAHRYAYEQLVGPIPEGLTLDHLCRNRTCVNPAHLEPVTLRENVLRGTSPSAIAARSTGCIHGHPWTLENTYWRMRANGRASRQCRACGTAYDRTRRAA